MQLSVRTSSPKGVLTLLSLRGVGPQVCERIVERFNRLEQVAEASPDDLTGLPAAARASLQDEDSWEQALARAEQLLEDAERHGVEVLTLSDERYPSWLRSVPNRPAVVYLKGSLRSGRRYVATVGTREPSRFGEEVTRRIIAVLAERGWSIVSGLAIGVDALSHRAALDAKAHTVAILANGLDTVYPKKNAKLAEEILAQGGALLSEQPFGTPAIPRNLVQRDRLQSGMSAGTIVMQTDIVGGTMHTVRFTLMQGRLLFAPVPSGQHRDEPKSRGILALTCEPGKELAKRLGALETAYAVLLEQAFADRPVATPLESRRDYQRLLSMLDEAASTTSDPGDKAQGAQLQIWGRE